MIARSFALQLALGFLAVLLAGFVVLRNPGDRPAFYEAWGIFHYFLGAKYFDEIGPFDLYACAIRADAEANQLWQATTQVRDLQTYLLRPASTLQCPRERFTADRWRAFVEDVAWMTRPAPLASYWPPALLMPGPAQPGDGPTLRPTAVTDKGYNATPFSSVLFGRLANASPVQLDLARFLLFNLDVLLVGIAVVIVWRSAGATMALFTLVLSLGYFGNFGRIGGNFVQYAWFPSLALAVAAWRAGRPVVSGASLGVAAGLQVFPVFFAIPIVVHGVRAIAQRDRDRWMRVVLFIASLAAALAVCFVVGSTSQRGPNAWVEWQQKIALHSSYLRGEVFNIGLPNLIASLSSNDHTDSVSYFDDLPRALARQEALNHHVAVWYVLAALLMLLTICAAWYESDEGGFHFGFIPIYALLSLSPYYHFAIVLLPFMVIGLSYIRYIVIVSMLVLLLLVHLVTWPGSYISFSFQPHLVSQVLIAGFMFFIGLLSLVGRGRPRLWTTRMQVN